MRSLILVIFLIATTYAVLPDCASYCGNITVNCVGVNKQYTDSATCMLVCAALPLGLSAGETSGNTIGCRQYHTGAAAADATTHCIHAGPSGGGVCGGATTSLCEAYCNITKKACVGAAAIFSLDPVCMAACAAFNMSGTIADTAGNTAFCHLYHAGAALADPATHCAHASPSGNGVCGSKCENYCQISSQTCTGTTNKLYADMPTCLGFCGTIPTAGNYSDQAGNSVDCRIYHASAASALALPNVHCPHASHSGGSVCGAYCDEYCYLAATYCTGANSLNFATTAACMTACAGLKTTGLFGDTAGDSIQCRIYHLAAAKVLNDAATHCPHGNITSGSGVCGGAVTTSTTAGTSKTDKTGNAFGVLVSLVTLTGVLLI